MSKPRANTHYQGKVQWFDYDAYLDMSEDTCLYCLSQRDVFLLLALIEPVAWKRRWYSEIETPISTDTLDGWQATIQERLMSDVCAEIKEKLDQIFDKEGEIETKIDDLSAEVTAGFAATDLDLAALDTAVAGMVADLATLSAAVALDSVAIAGIAATVGGISTDLTGLISDSEEMHEDVDNIETVALDIQARVTKLKAIMEVTNNYNYQTSIQIVLPTGTYTSDPSDLTNTEQYARYLAFCNALLEWTYNEGILVMTQIDPNSGQLDTLTDYVVGLGITIQLGNYWQGSITNTLDDILTAFTTLTDLETVACFLFTYMRDLAPTYANFVAACNAFSYSNFNQQVIITILSAAIQYYDAFATFGSIYQSALAKAQASAPTSWSTCISCACVAASQSWDYRLGQKSQTLFILGRDILGAANEMEVGFKGIKTLNSFTGQYTDEFLIQVDLDCPCAIQDYSYEIFFGPAYAGGGGSATVEFQKTVSGVMTTYETHTLTTGSGLQVGTALTMGDQTSVCERILLHEQRFFGLPDMRYPIYFHSFAFTKV